ncbi:hypothetical protein ETAA8_21120 [Anatilimnocola aggregata]|uniref:Uncharacterized protein n=1 Tax=Anatilimnocola aggregata TaxID=2528021 RepID=A0A517Y9Z0_9BACT|nr:hypothetical protein [Anatilimnocola aggregata]QDU27028.1 hypothetical protein ETAA8_21120 [Anatilimnocola aggregata]
MTSISSIKSALSKLDPPVRWDLTQFALDLIGIFDPSPISDGANTIISLCRGDWFGAAINAVSMVPGADLAKILKLEKYLNSLKLVVKEAKRNPYLRVTLRPMMESFSKMLARLPRTNNTVIVRLDAEIKAFLHLPIGPQKFPLQLLKHTSPEHVRMLLKQEGFVMASAGEGAYKVASSKGVGVGSIEIWVKKDKASGGYFAVRMDMQGNAFKKDGGPGNFSIVSQTKSGVHQTHGGRPHYHKEWIPDGDYNTYLKSPTSNTFKYNDAGDLADDIAGTHIPR